jgi:phage-related minor tail protein
MAEILAQKEERAIEIIQYQREQLDERYEDTVEAYAEIRDQYGEALLEFQRQQVDTSSTAFEEAKKDLWEIEEVMNTMKGELSEMLNTRTQQEAADYELRIR